MKKYILMMLVVLAAGFASCSNDDIPMEENLRKDVGEMCNLSQGIKEQGIAIGQARGEGLLIKKMHKNGLTIQQIAQATEKDIEEVESIIEQDDVDLDIEVVNNL